MTESANGPNEICDLENKEVGTTGNRLLPVGNGDRMRAP